jgi:hypothetical protein
LADKPHRSRLNPGYAKIRPNLGHQRLILVQGPIAANLRGLMLYGTIS